MPTDLFISHSTADAETAGVLVTDFENRGITCWIAPRDIPMGSSYQNEIVAAIERCRAMLLLFSNAANNSEHVLREVELAAQGKKPIYPLRIDVSEPAGGLRYMLANKQWVERKALGSRLVDTIEQLLANSGRPQAEVSARTPPPAQVAAKSSRLPILAGAGALAVILAAGAFALQAGWLTPKKADEKKDKDVAEVIATAPRVPDPPKPPDTSPSQGSGAAQAPRAGVAGTPAGGGPAPEPKPEPKAEPKSEPVGRTPAADPDPAPVKEARLPVESGPAKTTPVLQISDSAPTRAEAEGGNKRFFRECDMCPVMAVVPSGRALIGSPTDEKNHERLEEPRQEIAILRPFAVGRYEVSFEQWFACVAEGGCNAYRPSDYGWGADTRPVINVSWADGKAFVDWLSKKTGANYRLLSEAEWEYAARGCTKICEATPFWFGSDISKARANYDWRFAYDGSPKALPPRRTVPIDAGEANPFGLVNVHGNVREWVEDCWNDSLAGLPRDGSARTTGDCRSHVVRGGSWADEPKDLRTAKRTWEIVAERRAQIGLRVARDLEP